MIYWDKTKASAPARRIPKADHIENSPGAKRYREQAIAGMKQAEAARIQMAYEKWKRERGLK